MKVMALRTALIAACAAIAIPAFAQNYPVKPIVMICPWPAGGSTDQHLRAFAQIASKYVGQNIVVENKPGAGGMLATASRCVSAFRKPARSAASNRARLPSCEPLYASRILRYFMRASSGRA